MKESVRIINCEQGSVEWFKVRLGVPTASNFSDVVKADGDKSKSWKKYAMKLASEILTDVIEAPYSNKDIQRGLDLEDTAISEYSKKTLNVVSKCGFLFDGKFGVSPDGLIGDDGMIEVKCPNILNHVKYIIEDRCPIEYYQQVQGALFVSGRRYCEFVSYNENVIPDKRLFIRTVYRDEAFISKLHDGLKGVCVLRDEYIDRIEGLL